jgi:uncharacterized membrane protein HdeD (DUF308 family)
MKLAVLVRNRWMIGVRGGLAIAFALALLLRPANDLATSVMIFAIYALVDGVWSIAAAARVSARPFDAWPVALEGCVSTAIGAVALFWPSVPRDFVHTLGAWGVGTGVLEVLAALALPRRDPQHWLLVTAGVSSLFLAVLVLGLPLADVENIVRVLIAYAFVFGVAMLVAASGFSGTQGAANLAAGKRLTL